MPVPVPVPVPVSVNNALFTRFIFLGWSLAEIDRLIPLLIYFIGALPSSNEYHRWWRVGRNRAVLGLIWRNPEKTNLSMKDVTLNKFEHQSKQSQ